MIHCKSKALADQSVHLIKNSNVQKVIVGRLKRNNVYHVQFSTLIKLRYFELNSKSISCDTTNALR